MTIVGDMAAYVSSTCPGVDMPTAQKVIDQALEAADDIEFAQKFDNVSDYDHAVPIYFEVINFLRKVNR
jgi:hypothetical protein